MNLEERIAAAIAKAPKPTAESSYPLSSLAPISRAEIRALQLKSLRENMKYHGATDAEIDAYLKASGPPV